MLAQSVRSRERLLEEVGHVDRFADRRDAVEQHHELVATQPRREVPLGRAGRQGDLTKHPTQSFGDALEEQVTDLMAETVVDDLESVEVQEEHGRRNSPAHAGRG